MGSEREISESLNASEKIDFNIMRKPGGFEPKSILKRMLAAEESLRFKAACAWNQSQARAEFPPSFIRMG